MSCWVTWAHCRSASRHCRYKYAAPKRWAHWWRFVGITVVFAKNLCGTKLFGKSGLPRVWSVVVTYRLCAGMKTIGPRGTPITSRSVPAVPSPAARIAVSNVFIVPGNGCTPVLDCNFYSSVADRLRAAGFSVVVDDMPDPHEAKESVWLPHLQVCMPVFVCCGCGVYANNNNNAFQKRGAGPRSLIIGHSSGAEAAMRLAERTELAAIVLVSPCYTDLGYASEAISGYYNRPWQWDVIRKHVSHVGQFSSPSDHLVPYAEEQW